jgi:hypothetical protein
MVLDLMVKVQRKQTKAGPNQKEMDQVKKIVEEEVEVKVEKIRNNINLAVGAGLIGRSPPDCGSGDKGSIPSLTPTY